MVNIRITCPRCGQFDTEAREIRPHENAYDYGKKVVRSAVVQAHKEKDLLCTEPVEFVFLLSSDVDVGAMAVRRIGDLTKPPI